MLDLRSIIQSIPKVELHCHIDGSIRPKTIYELALDSGLNMPSTNFDEFKKSFQVINEVSSLSEYLSKFYFPIKVMQSRENIYRVTLELLEDAKKDGIAYMEMRFYPLQHLMEGLSVEEVMEAVLSAMQDAKNKYNIQSGLVLCCIRNVSIEEAFKIINIAKNYMASGVVGVDLAGDEVAYAPELFKEAFDRAYDYGLKITIHAGEAGDCNNIIKAIDILHAERIGHGVLAYNDVKVIEALIEKHIPLEMCPTSNVDTKAINSYKEHPIKSYYQKGVKVTLNTDNRTISNITLLDEYIKLVEVHGFTLDEIIEVIGNGIKASFAPEGYKSGLLEEFNTCVLNIRKI